MLRGLLLARSMAVLAFKGAQRTRVAQLGSRPGSRGCGLPARRNCTLYEIRLISGKPQSSNHGLASERDTLGVRPMVDKVGPKH